MTDLTLDYEYPGVMARASSNLGRTILGRSEKYLTLDEARRLCDTADACNASVGPAGVKPCKAKERRA